METVGATRRFFACAHKGGAERANVRRARTCLARSGEKHHRLTAFDTGVRRRLPVQTLLVTARLGFGLDRRMMNGKPGFEHFRKSASCSFCVGSVD